MDKYSKIKYKDCIKSIEIKELMKLSKERKWEYDRQCEMSQVTGIELEEVIQKWDFKDKNSWNEYFSLNKEFKQEEINNWYNLFGNYYSIEIASYNTSGCVNWWSFILTILKKYYKDNNSLKLLDYGAGIGDMAILTKEFYISGEFHLLEVSSSLLNICDKRLSTRKINNYFLINNISQIKSKLDIIFCNDVLEHVLEPINICKDIDSVSKNETLLFLSHTFGDFENTPWHLKSNEGKGREVGKWFRENNWSLLQGWFPPVYGKLYKKEIK